jgi:hypothetical protein
MNYFHDNAVFFYYGKKAMRQRIASANAPAVARAGKPAVAPPGGSTSLNFRQGLWYTQA